MKIRTLAAALALTAGVALTVPPAAEAGHRHGRHCRHRRAYVYEYRGDHYDRGYYDRGYRRGYDSDDYYYGRRHGRRGGRYYSDYDYGYAPPPRYGYAYRRVWYPRPRVHVHYHGRARCHRSHVSVRFGW